MVLKQAVPGFWIWSGSLQVKVPMSAAVARAVDYVVSLDVFRDRTIYGDSAMMTSFHRLRVIAAGIVFKIGFAFRSR